MGSISTRLMGSVVGRAMVVFSLAMMMGCQTQSVQPNRLAAHIALVDQSGLRPDVAVTRVKVDAAVPRGWSPTAPVSTPLYEAQQWRSPSKFTGVGVVYVHMPLPFSAKLLASLAKSQYAKSHPDPKIQPKVLSEWTDSLGREWFEGENEKYHVTGYVVTQGFDAWAVYSGYRLNAPKQKAEINMAFRSMDSIVPLPLVRKPFAVASR